MTGWSVCPWKRAVERGDRQKPGVVLGELPEHLDLELAHVAAGELHRKTTELRRQRDVGTEHLEVVGSDGGDVDRVRNEPAVERRDHLLGDDHTGSVLCFLGGGREVRRDDDVRRGQQRPVIRLLLEDVDRRPGDLARFERRDQRGLVDELASRRIHDSHAVAHLRDRFRADRVARLVVEGQVEGDEIGPCEHLVEGSALDTELAKALGRDERVVGEHLHLQADRPTGDLASDPAEAEHAQHLVGELDPAPLRTLPASCDQRGMRLGDVARERDQQPDRVLGCGDDVRLRRIRHHDPAPGGRLDIDVVDPDSRATDHLQPRPAGDHVGGHLGRRTDDERVVGAEDLLE